MEKFPWDPYKFFNADQNENYPGDIAFFDSPEGQRFLAEKAAELLGQRINDPRFMKLCSEMNGKWVSGELFQLTKQVVRSKAAGADTNKITEAFLSRIARIPDDHIVRKVYGKKK